MPRNYAYSDIRFSQEIDAIIEGGDISFTSGNTNESILGYIISIIQDKPFDWIFLSEGASLEDFKGEKNVKKTAEAIKGRLENKITESRIVNLADLTIIYVILDENNIFFRIILSTETGDETLEFLVDLNSLNSYIEVL